MGKGEELKFTEFDGLILLDGPGLDNLLEDNEIERLVLIDDYFSEIYGEYIFAGYDTVAYLLNVLPSIPDMFSVASLMMKKPSIVVCGFEGDRCLLALSSYLIFAKGLDVNDAISEARKVLKNIYEKGLELPNNVINALKAFKRLRDMLGLSNLSILMSLAMNYDFGWGKLHWGEGLTWLNNLNAPDDLFMAYAMHFLAEGHGKREEIFPKRVEAVGKENILKFLGEEIGNRVIDILEAFAFNKENEGAKALGLIEELKPGEGKVKDVWREGKRLIVVGEYDEEKIKSFLPVLGLEEVTKAFK